MIDDSTSESSDIARGILGNFNSAMNAVVIDEKLVLNSLIDFKNRLYFVQNEELNNGPVEFERYNIQFIMSYGVQMFHIQKLLIMKTIWENVSFQFNLKKLLQSNRWYIYSFISILKDIFWFMYHFSDYNVKYLIFTTAIFDTLSIMYSEQYWVLLIAKNAYLEHKIHIESGCWNIINSYINSEEQVVSIR
jgi:hypothetical protein